MVPSRARKFAVLSAVGLAVSIGMLQVVGAASPTPAATPTPTTAPPSVTSPPGPLIGPFAEPQLVPGMGYDVTCNIAALSTNCSHLISSTGPMPAGISPTSPSALVTMLVNVPSAYQYLQDWVPYNAATSGPIASAPAADSVQYDLAAASGSGATTGEEMVLDAEDTWSVPSGSTMDVAATMNSSGNTDRCGALIGQFGSRFLNYPVPFYAPNGSTYSPNDTDLAGVTYKFQMANTQDTYPLCVVLTTGGAEVFGATFPSGQLAEPRQNALYARVIAASGEPFPLVGTDGGGWDTTNYFQHSAGSDYEAWSSVSVASAPPYYTFANTTSNISIGVYG